jgi:Ammonium Transporter Family
MPLLAAEALDLRGRQASDAELGERLLHLVQLEGLMMASTFFTLTSSLARWEPRSRGWRESEGAFTLSERRTMRGCNLHASLRAARSWRGSPAPLQNERLACRPVRHEGRTHRKQQGRSPESRARTWQAPAGTHRTAAPGETMADPTIPEHFAGSSVVHLTGGVIALTLGKMIGPRIGKYGKDGRVNPIPAHNIPQVMTGTFILAFGWFGFNAGSTLSGMDTRLTVVAVNTMIAGATGAFAAFLYAKTKWGKADPSWMANGMLAGLVAITAPCAFVSAWAAALIGAVAGVLVILAAVFIDAKLKIDDPVGASAVHGVNGAWGILALGLFANGTYGQGLNGVARGVTGLLYGDAGQFMASVIGIAANVCYVAPVAALAFFVIGKLVGNRIPAEDEINGADMAEMGVLGYAPDAGPHLGVAPHGRESIGAAAVQSYAQKVT